MPLHLNKLPELALPQNALLDFTPVQRMAEGWEKKRQFDETKALEREKLDMQRSHLGIAQGKADQEAKQRQIEEWGRVASVIDETKDPAQRQAMWGKFVSSHPQFPSVFQKYGVDPNDHVNGPKFLRSQAGLYDPQKEAESRARINMTNAHANYYDAAASGARETAAARTANAETRRFAAVAAAFADRTPTQQEWEQANQPGGVINVAFGGRMIPYDQAPVVLAQAKRRGRSIDDQELEGLGFSPETIREMKRNQQLENALGKPKVGHQWQIGEDGKPFQKKLTENDDKNAIPLPQLEANLEGVKDAFALISGVKNEKTGKLDGGANIIQKGISALPGGYFQQGLNEAYTQAEHSALQLSYALSGKQIGQAEQKRIVEYFVPARGDSQERAAFKLNAMASLYNRLIEAKRAGKYVGGNDELFYSELRKQSQALRRFDAESERAGKAPPAPQTKGPQRPGPAKPDYSGMSNEDLLRSLNE